MVPRPMNKKIIVIGIALILVGIWFYSALSSFEVEEGTHLKRLIIREGIVRTEDEVARALADEMDFDIEGAYKIGYTARDVADYLMKEPHKHSFTYHEGRYYQGRVTIPYLIPFAVSLFFVLIGIGTILLKGIRKKS